MPDALASIGTRQTPQNESARADQVPNNAGGYVFAYDAMGQALRFLILGTEGGTYYSTERELTKQNAKVIIDLANGKRAGKLLDLVLDVSESGRAARQHPTIFTLAALCASENKGVRSRAVLAIPRVCRTGTMLFLFARYVENFRGWGRGLRRGVARWYEGMDPDRLAFQVTKYAQREGWSHRDLLRLSHPKAPTSQHKSVYQYVTSGTLPEGIRPHDLIAGTNYPEILLAVEHVKATTTPQEWANAASTYHLTWEQLPDAALSSPEVWDAMLPTLGYTALVRQLGRLARIGYTKPFTAGAHAVVAKLSDADEIKRSRIHPLQILTALATYATGSGFRGKESWEPLPDIVAALDRAFYLAFGNVESANKRTLLALDVSGSMQSGNVANSPLSPIQAEMALALVTIATEPEVYTMGFSGNFVPVPLYKGMQLREAVALAAGFPFDRTDCAIPMLWALNRGIEVDTFVILTDNETWAGLVHPFEALKRYRQATGIPARLAVIGLTSTGFSIADPRDAGMLDMVGMDTATPRILSEFSAGRL